MTDVTDIETNKANKTDNKSNFDYKKTSELQAKVIEGLSKKIEDLEKLLTETQKLVEAKEVKSEPSGTELKENPDDVAYYSMLDSLGIEYKKE